MNKIKDVFYSFEIDRTNENKIAVDFLKEQNIENTNENFDEDTIICFALTNGKLKIVLDNDEELESDFDFSNIEKYDEFIEKIEDFDEIKINLLNQINEDITEKFPEVMDSDDTINGYILDFSFDNNVEEVIPNLVFH